jgi:RNA polymerase sigma factor (sigma-70 family)
MSAPMREATHTYRGSREGLAEPLQTLFGVGSLAGLTDGQLLERFADGHGESAEAAFTALVERHGPMVLGVCRAVLGDRHDAEDALQATFLVLALRAGSIRRGDAVASWLYSTARRVALRARRQAARHREGERRRAAQAGPAELVSAPPADPCPELYDELDRLPEPFRAVVVLCDLEGHSYEQAAGMLHCPVGTIQSRLARGRQRLRIRLESRGLSSAVVLVGAGAGPTARSATAAVSSHLATAIAKTAVGVARGQTIASMVAKPVAGLVGTEIRRLLMSRALTVLTTLVTTGLVAAAGIGLVIAGQRDDAKPNRIAATRKTDAGPIHVRVVDVQGKGVPELPVELFGADFDPPRVYRTTAEGHLQIPREDGGDGTLLVARRDRETLGWAQVPDPNTNEPAGTQADPVVMKLLPLTHRVEGTALDRDGKPIAGVDIEHQVLSHPTNGTVILSLHRQASRMGALLAGAVTDQTGRFVLMLPQEAIVSLSVSHRRYIGRIDAQPDSRTLEPMILEPAGAIAGTVTDAATGRPVAGVIVGAQFIEFRKRLRGGWGDATTDDQGRFVINSLEPGVYNLLFQSARGHVQATARAVEGLRVRAGADTPVDLQLIDGRSLRGVVIDQETDRPVAGSLVGCYGPARPQSGGAVQNYRTDENGRFTFYLPPGEQHVYIMDANSFGRLSRQTVVLPDRGEIEPVRLIRASPATDHSTLYMRKAAIQPAAPAEVTDHGEAKAEPKELIEAEIRPDRPAAAIAKEKAKTPAPKLRTVTGHVRDPQGRPVPGVSVSVNTEPGAEPFDLAATDRDGLFVLPGLPHRALQINLNRPNFRSQMEALPADRDAVEWTYGLELDPRSKQQVAATSDEPVPPDVRQRLTFVDLTPRGNDPMTDGPGGGGNDLNRVPRGVHKLGDTFFRIGAMMVHAQGQMAPELPRAIKGIKVQAEANRLRILHATQYVETPGKIIGAYLVHYTDGSNERIPIVYGRNVVNWWSFASAKEEPTEARVAWTGSSDSTDLNPGIKIRLFDLTWTNPHPEKEVAALDILSAGTACDPFLVAVTLERDR